MILVSILVFLSFWATTPAGASDSDCESFMYGSLCLTGRLSDIIWVIPHLENEKKCQVSNESTLSGLKLDTCFFPGGVHGHTRLQLLHVLGIHNGGKHGVLPPQSL